MVFYITIHTHPFWTMLPGWIPAMSFGAGWNAGAKGLGHLVFSSLPILVTVGMAGKHKVHLESTSPFKDLYPLHPHSTKCLPLCQSKCVSRSDRGEIF
jgi:hypothetical protein